MRIRTISQILAEENESMFSFDDVVIDKNFLRKGQTWVISGATGIGKSVLAMQLAASLALGEKTLGLDIVRPAKTLLLHSENPIADEKIYFDDIVSQFELDKKADFCKIMENNFRFRCKTGRHYSVDDFISKLDAALRANKYDIVIVDSLTSFVGCDFSSYSEVSNLFCKINELKSKHHFAMVLIHHFCKPQFRSGKLHPAQWGMGGKAISNYADIMSAVLKTKGENEFAFMHCKPHDEAEIPTVRIAQCQNGNNAWEAKNV